MREHSEELAGVITLEMGKPLAEARGEVIYGGDFVRWFAEEAVRISGRSATTPAGTGRLRVLQRPVGPCYFITPWNFPLAMVTRKIAPALAAGCTAVIKPADLTPLTTLYFAELLRQAGLPDGVLNVLTTSRAAKVSEVILTDPRLRKLSFTGSTAVGRRLLELAASTVLRTSMELGGNAPFLVFHDADIDAAATAAMIAKFRNTGQACTAANRFLVHESVAEQFLGTIAERVRALRMGPGTEPGVHIGPLIDTFAVEKVGGLIDDAIARGAELVAGGTRGQGNFYAPTVLANIAPGSRILTEEIFGPVLAMSTFTTENEAVARANDTEYGLAAYVFTRDLARAQRMLESLDTGMIGLNTGLVSDAAAPFGGIKHSGLGREGGTEGIHEYLETKYAATPDPFA
jgi:succinate-semialdehyde dehydrogenase/glutarate-semialdehyde dehydrogenase